MAAYKHKRQLVAVMYPKMSKYKGGKENVIAFANASNITHRAVQNATWGKGNKLA